MLELGLCPIRYIIKKKRILYFHKVLKSDDKNLVKKVLPEQMKKPKRGDFSEYLKHDLEEVGMDSYSVTSFESFSKNEFKRMVRKKIKEAAFKYLVTEKSKQKKGSIIKYNNLSIQNYLKSSAKIKVFDAKQIFHLRSDSLDVASNFSKKYLHNNCIINERCKGEDSQSHYYQCPFMLNDSILTISDNIPYEEIYGEDESKQLFIMRNVMKGYNQRNMILSSFHNRNEHADP